MTSIYITACAFIALNDPNDTYHDVAQEYVQSLFSETVKLYTSDIEVLFAAKHIHKKVSKERSLRFLHLLRDGGITLFQAEIEVLEESAETYTSLDKKLDNITPLDLYRVVLLKKKGVRRVFSFDPALKAFGFVVTPQPSTSKSQNK